MILVVEQGSNHCSRERPLNEPSEHGHATAVGGESPVGSRLLWTNSIRNDAMRVSTRITMHEKFLRQNTSDVPPGPQRRRADLRTGDQLAFQEQLRRL